ncbi:MAG: DciA family protein [Planctomycetota bacterium]|jgi:predicted nucleic acid-binding Zn ribbon protein
MDDSERLRSFEKVGLKGKRVSKNTATLGDTVRQLMEDRISPRQARFESVARLWSGLLPVELGRHCRLTEISGGQLKVLADSPAYLYELRLCSPQLLKELQRRCPQARIRKIKLAIG